MIKYLEYNLIDKKKWDDCIGNAFNGAVYAYSWYLDVVFIKINSVFHYLWRAVDQEDDEIDILDQKRTTQNRRCDF